MYARVAPINNLIDIPKKAWLGFKAIYKGLKNRQFDIINYF